VGRQEHQQVGPNLRTAPLYKDIRDSFATRMWHRCNKMLTRRLTNAALIDASGYPADTAAPSFQPRVKCTRCGGRNVDVRPNWKEQPTGPTKLRWE
jgi:hypothetical protein